MRNLMLISASLLMLTFSSCDNRENVVGQWQMMPTKVDLPNTATSSATTSLVFTADGNVTATSDLNITEAIASNGDIISPYQISVSATSTISGVWQYAHHENDEIDIVWDDSTFTLNIDPDAVTFAANAITEQQSPSFDDLKPATVDRYKAMLTPELKVYYARFAHIDDIKVKDGMMKCEIMDQDYILKGMDQNLPK